MVFNWTCTSGDVQSLESHTGVVSDIFRESTNLFLSQHNKPGDRGKGRGIATKGEGVDRPRWTAPGGNQDEAERMGVIS